MEARERLLVETLVSFAETLVSDYDVAELFYRLVESCVKLAEADDAGLLLKSRAGDLDVAAATSESTHIMELLQLQAQEGPCLDAFRSGAVVETGPLSAEAARSRWPVFAALAEEAGFDSVLAMPLHVRDTVIGSLNLFRIGPGDAGEQDVAAAKALADLATIAIIQDRAAVDAQEVVDQLQTALDTRVSIEQAKGILAERAQISVGTAFSRMRDYARANNVRLRDVADRIVSGDLVP
jgi:GAF domain-containing protein